MWPDIESLGVFKKLAVIEVQIELLVGGNPPAHGISAATKVLRASAYSGLKFIKLRVHRTGQSDTSGGLKYARVESLEIAVV